MVDTVAYEAHLGSRGPDVVKLFTPNVTSYVQKGTSGVLLSIKTIIHKTDKWVA